ncbi:N-acetylglucosaminyldiphosphoundecaprenol N-acetyl-beta-D-mannosaminyltransferase [Caloramator quimbayensis]|uniref:N-acetylglucosaminyldiphosphoundecaprenol N-acetyl-beta-D-mannosaminyltransferase n=1 Tax=Caloramator quimbayensis TaxID=1147123 RepID=A0A1T4XHN2_9CLOT|nr:WecB/TagA/CpsF family glycosyltransferase [Caloramator quimbayensis]SKA88618.1 N-acetylglucosaminyldiphosphoundecaprenol N-acetyl-beta-D-mannosaminyltransferase [Caloramator quimbayensis]
MKKLFGLNFYDKDIDELKKNLEEHLLKQNNETECLCIFTPNVDHIISVYKRKEVFEAYKEAGLLIADGWPIEFVSKLKGERVYQITGVDLMDRLLEISNKHSLNIYCLGSEDETLDLMKENLTKKFKGIKNIGLHNGYFKEEEDRRILNEIKENKTDILFVGMGHPKQELWLHRYKKELSSSIAVAVGGAFKIYSNEVKRAPVLVRKLKLEWFWRFLNEPRRLFKRYFIRYLDFIKITLLEIKNKKII